MKYRALVLAVLLALFMCVGTGIAKVPTLKAAVPTLEIKVPTLMAIVPTIDVANLGSGLALSAEPPIPVRLISRAFDYAIVGQGGDEYFVSRKPDQVTLYKVPLAVGTYGLLAHNDRAGRRFYELKPGDQLSLQSQDETVVTYQIDSVILLQSIGTGYPYPEFLDLQTGLHLSGEEAIRGIYLNHPGALILQTCLERDGRPDWGLTFWIGYPVSIQTSYFTNLWR